MSMNPAVTYIKLRQVNKMNEGKFTLFKAANGQFYFNLRAANNRIIMQSQGYAAKRGAMKGIASVKRYAPAAVFVDSTSDVE